MAFLETIYLYLWHIDIYLALRWGSWAGQLHLFDLGCSGLLWYATLFMCSRGCSLAQVMENAHLQKPIGAITWMAITHPDPLCPYQ